jgi:hypothetical protein
VKDPYRAVQLLVDVGLAVRQDDDPLALKVLLESRAKAVRAPRARTGLALPFVGQAVYEGSNVAHQGLELARGLA